MTIGTALITSVLVLQAAPPRDVRTLTLERSTQKALESQPELRLAHAQTQAAMARAGQAIAPLFPQVHAYGTYLRAKGTSSPRGVSIGQGNAVCPVTSTFGTYDCWNFGLSANQLIYDFGTTWERWRSAQAFAKGQEYNELTTRLQIVLAVRIAYFQARSQKSLTVVSGETLTDQDKHLVQIQAFVDVGTRPEIDLAQARTNAANARVQLILSENAYATAKAQLNQLMGSVETTDYNVADDAFPPVPGEDQPIDALVQSAIATRPELATLTKQIDAEEQLLRAAQGGYGPALGASAGLAEAGAGPSTRSLGEHRRRQSAEGPRRPADPFRRGTGASRGACDQGDHRGRRRRVHQRSLATPSRRRPL
jgi:outer membrane protein